MNNLNQSHKQLIFGEQIRKKQRDKIKQQIRLKFEEQTHVKNLFIHLPHSLSDIYGICRKSKSGEYLVAEAFINFVQHNKFYIEVNNLKERVFWGFIISLAFQYWPHKTNILFKSIGCNLLQQAQKQQGMELIYMVLIAAMKSVNQLSQSEQQHQQLVHYITKTISLLYYKIQNSQDLSIMSISYEGLCFLRAAFVLIPTKLSDFACYDRFLYITCIQIDRYLNKMESLQQIIKILIILTYHDGQAYQNITYFLIYGTLKLATNNNQILNTNCNNSTHCDLINKLKFILDFVDIKKSKYISANLASLIANIVQNNCQLTGQLMKNGIHQILYLNAFDDTFQQNGQKQQWKRQDSEKVRFSWRQKYQFARSYVVIVGCIYYNMQIMQEIRNRDVVEKMLKIIDSFGQTQTSILEISNHAFCRLLEIGQQIIGGQENKLNPYILKLNHLDGNHILGKFSEYFDDMFSKYDI